MLCTYLVDRESHVRPIPHRTIGEGNEGQYSCDAKNWIPWKTKNALNFVMLSTFPGDKLPAKSESKPLTNRKQKYRESTAAAASSSLSVLPRFVSRESPQR